MVVPRCIFVGTVCNLQFFWEFFSHKSGFIDFFPKVETLNFHAEILPLESFPFEFSQKSLS